MTRTHRFVGGVVLGYAQLALATVVGLWMTPFLLGRLGEHTLGFWLVGQQLLGYLLLMDIGVNALLPRETAFATGRAGGVETATDLPLVVARARQAVWWQLPIVGLTALALWWWLPPRWSEAAGPIALLLAGFVALFPTRLYQAFLQGVQELPFLSRIQILSWSGATVTTVWLVLEGAGLYALVIGWLVGQALSALCTGWRTHEAYRRAWPGWALRPAWREITPYLRKSIWISIAQVAQVFLTGSDLLMIGSLLGSAAVVAYSCTGKLAMVLTNYPQIIMVAATPALSEMWAARQRPALLDTVVALTLLMLSVSGLIACLILALNGSFVTWWVGPKQFGGHLLTWMFALLLVFRHLNITLIYGLLAFGGERRISITNMIEGLVSVIAGLALIPVAGALGAVGGSLLAVTTVSLPANVSALGRAAGISPRALAAKTFPWLWRFTVIALACAAVPWVWNPAGPQGLAAAALTIASIYGLAMTLGLWRGPLGTYVAPRLGRFLPLRFRWVAAPSIGS